MVKYLILLFSIGLIGCNASRRASRLVSKAERLDPNVLVSDTIFIRDTIVIKGHDTTVINNLIVHDTVTVINNEKLTLKYFYNPNTNEINHNVKLLRDTIIYKKEVPVTKARIVKPWHDWSNPWIYLISFTLMLVITKNKK